MNLLIVNYHYFREEAYPSGIYPINKNTFIKQLEILAGKYSFISQGDLLAHLNGYTLLESNNCLITFDDGLKEQMSAFDVMRDMGIPGIFYVPTDPIEQKQVLDVHKLHYIRANRDDKFLYDLLDDQFQISGFRFNDDALAVQYRYDEPLARKVKYFLNFELNEIQKKSFLTSAFKELAPNESVFSQSLYMDKSDLKRLADADALGSHGASHRPLTKLEFAEASADIRHSVEQLESWTGHPIRSFAYPFGGTTAVSPALETAFTGTSIAFALTMLRGINSQENLKEPYLLKRVDTNDVPEVIPTLISQKINLM